MNRVSLAAELDRLNSLIRAAASSRSRKISASIVISQFVCLEPVSQTMIGAL